MSSPALTFFLSQTIRNQATYQKFRQLLFANGFYIDELEPFDEVFKADSEAEIKILKISKTQAATCAENMDSKIERDFPPEKSVETEIV